MWPFSNNDEKKLSFALGGYRFSSDGKYLRYQSVYAKSFRVLLKDIDTVSLDTSGNFSNSEVKIIGRGTQLASVKLPKSWAEKAQEFIMEEVERAKVS